MEIRDTNMQSLKATPGPWTAVKARGQRGEIGVFEVKAVEDLADFAHRSIVNEKAGLDEADATLIAAAPDLLEALKRLLADCVDPNITPEMAFKSGAISGNHFNSICMAQRAIAKGEGK